MTDELKRYALFKGLSEAELGVAMTLLDAFTIEEANGLLFDRGAPADSAWLVRSGLLRVEVPRAEQRLLEVARLGPGSVVGELVLVEAAPRGLRVRALEPSRLWRMDLKRFQALKQQGSPVAWKIVRNVALQVCDRFRATNQLLELDLNAPRPEVTASTTGMPAIRIDEGIAPVTTSPRGGVWDTLRGFFGGA
jgi:CRP-like cAMP-binding protein